MPVLPEVASIRDLPGTDRTLASAVLDHAPRRAVLDRAAGIEAIRLAEHDHARGDAKKTVDPSSGVSPMRSVRRVPVTSSRSFTMEWVSRTPLLPSSVDPAATARAGGRARDERLDACVTARGSSRNRERLEKRP